MPSVDAMLDSMNAREFNEWMAYYALEPWGVLAGDVRAAIVAQTVAAVHSDPKAKTLKLEAFMPTWSREMLDAPDGDNEGEAPDEPWKQWKDAFALLAKAHGGRGA